MYTQSMMKILRNMAGGEAGSPAGAAPAGGTQGGAGEGAAAGGSASSAAPEYLSKADFEAKWGELQGHLSRLTPAERREEKREEAKPGQPTKPDVSQYDFKKPGELDRYNHDNYKYHRHLDRLEEAKEATTKAAQERAEKSAKGHKAREIEYKKANPTYDADLKAHGPLHVENEVAESVFESEESAAIVHHFVKNKGLADELNQMALMGNVRGVDRKIGEIEAQIRAERKALEANAEAAAVKVPRQNFSKGSKGANHEPTAEERYNRFRS